jgi:hypothetical protein
MTPRLHPMPISKFHGAAEFALASSPARQQRRSDVSQPPHRGIIWLASLAVVLPFTFGETGKYVIALLFIPAIYVFMTSKSRVTACDIFICAAAFWMVAVKSASPELFATASDAFAFLSAYMVARAFLSTEPSLRQFVRTLKFMVLLLVALCVLDTLTGTFFTRDLIEKVFPNPRMVRPEAIEIHRSILGVNVLRAASIFEHPILFGTYLSVAATIFLSAERSTGARVFYCGVCLIGVLLSVSSAPMLGCVIVFLVYAYDRLLARYPLKWKVLYVVVTASIGTLFLVSNNPVTWLLRNATLDPADGYYRLMIWQNAFEYISRSPLTGADPVSWSKDVILGNSIDCVWLVLALECGLPVVALLLLASVSACGVFGRKIDRRLINQQTLRMRTGFSTVMFLFAFVGLAVHFWGAIWMLWGLCFGIRASIEAYCLAGGLPVGTRERQGQPPPRDIGQAFPHAIGRRCYEA